MGTKRKDYIPGDKFELGVWLVQFLEAVRADVNHYGINQEKLKALEAFVAAYLADLKVEKSLIDQKRTQVAKTGKDRKLVVDCSRGIAQIIKASSDYDEQVGEKFDIIGDNIGFDQDTFKPIMTVKKVMHGVEISFEKSQTDGVNIYRKLDKSGDDWAFLARDTHSPYVDNKEMDTHATYQYMVRAIIDDQEIGIESATQTITV